MPEGGFDEFEGVFHRPAAAVEAEDAYGAVCLGHGPIGQQVPGLAQRPDHLGSY
jgi:hypothetical protein